MGNLAKEKVELSIKNLREKTARIYFFVQDTKGNAKASIRLIYQMAMTLKKNGYNTIILHEKSDYTGVGSWLGEEYMSELPHKSIEGQNLEISPEDFLVVPETITMCKNCFNTTICTYVRDFTTRTILESIWIFKMYYNK